ncbi:D-glycero-beta-D-manno-heptose-7-phosphate kinase [soil metagenome]
MGLFIYNYIGNFDHLLNFTILDIDYTQIIDSFARTKVLVIGDVMLDTYLYGQTNRISPEAPVPIVEVTHQEHRPGGAANVAINLIALGAKVTLCGLVGDDNEGRVLREQLEDAGVACHFLAKNKNRPTTHKNRIVSRNQQMLRFDREKKEELGGVEASQLQQAVLAAIGEQPSVVILQDYNKGVLFAEMITAILMECRKRKIPVAVDPKKQNFFAYQGASLFKPNLKEIREALNLNVDPMDNTSLHAAAMDLIQRLNAKQIMITLSEHGVFVADKTNSLKTHAHLRNIADVSGAGDTVIAVAALCLANNVPMGQNAHLANLAGGLVCEKPGVASINKKELLAEALKTNYAPQVL